MVFTQRQIRIVDVDSGACPAGMPLKTMCVATDVTVPGPGLLCIGLWVASRHMVVMLNMKPVFVASEPRLPASILVLDYRITSRLSQCGTMCRSMATINAIRKRWTAATAGPWRWANWNTWAGELEAPPFLTLEASGAGPDPIIVAPYSTEEVRDRFILKIEEDWDTSCADLDCIASAPTDVTYLLDCLRRYGRHTDECQYERWRIARLGVLDIPRPACDCGWDQA